MTTLVPAIDTGGTIGLFDSTRPMRASSADEGGKPGLPNMATRRPLLIWASSQAS